MSRGRHWRIALAIGACALVLGGCSGTDNGRTGSDAADGDPEAGGSLTVIQASEPRILDPATMGNSLFANAAVGNSLFGTLLTDNPDGTFDYVLAESLKSVDGGTTWTLTLRNGLQYSDGSPMDAEDVAFNWKRLQDPELGSTSRAVAEYIDEMTADGQALTFTLTEPIANFGHALARDTLNWIAKPEALEAGQAEFDENPIGAGPFTLDSWTRGGKMILKKNARYFDEPRPYLDELVLMANGDEGQRFATVESGGADITVSNSAAHFRRGKEAGLETTKLELNGGVAQWLNTRFAPFDDPRAREAVAKAIDLEAVNAAAYEGVGKAPKTLFAKRSPFYSETSLTAYDAKAAQTLFDQLAAEGKPVDFTITAYQTSESRRVGEAFQAQLSAYEHVDVAVEVLDIPAGLAKNNAREFQMSAGGSPSFVDPETSLYQALHGNSDGNYSGIDDPQMNAALERGRLSSDVDERRAAYAAVAERFAATNPAILYTEYTNGLAYAPHVAGLLQYGNSSPRFDDVWTTGR